MKVPQRLALSSSLIVAAATKSYSYRSSFVRTSIRKQHKMTLSSAAVPSEMNNNGVISSAIAVTPTDFTLTCSDGIQLAAQVWKPVAVQPPPTTTTTSGRTRKILCVHGWMDNCRSYHYLAPTVLQRILMNAATTTAATHENDDDSSSDDPVVEIVTIDLPGHGWSSHKSLDGPPIHITDYVYYIAEAIQQLQWSATPTNGIVNGASSNGSSSGNHPNDEGNDQHPSTPNDSEIVLVGHSMGAAICCMYAATFPEQIHKLVLLEGGTFLFHLFFCRSMSMEVSYYISKTYIHFCCNP